MFLVVGCVDLDGRELWNEIDFLKKQNAEQAKELEEENAKFAAFEGVTFMRLRLKMAVSAH